MKAVSFCSFIFSLILGLSSFGGVGGVSGGPSAANFPKFVQVQVCGMGENPDQCTNVLLRNRPESDFGKGPSFECIEFFGDIQQSVPCRDEVQNEVPGFIKRLFNSERKPYSNTAESGAVAH